MADTSYGCFLVQQKRDAERRACQKMSAEEKANFKHNMVEIDEAGVDNKQSTPPSLTPM
jgi:hypothetical protein